MNEFRDSRGPAGLPPRLASLPWAPPETFLGIPPEETPSFESARVVVLPTPYEATVSYLGGTRFGPRALLHASRYVELYDHELDTEPYRCGVYTLPPLSLSGAGPAEALTEVRQAVDALLDAGKFVVMIGGEHSITPPAVLAHADRMPPDTLSVLQLDAHADLRTEYEGTPLSHACAMYRVHERASIVPVGIRSLTADERTLMRERGIDAVWGYELGRAGWMDRVMAGLREHVYITVDVDYFDPAVMPSTGTPEPGGGAWYPTLRLLERVFRERTVVGCDVVELAPLPGVAAPDVLAAKLVYKLIAFHVLD